MLFDKDVPLRVFDVPDVVVSNLLVPVKSKAVFTSNLYVSVPVGPAGQLKIGVNELLKEFSAGDIPTTDC